MSDVIAHVPTLERAIARLNYAARLKPGWSAALPRDEARALLNEIARMRKLAA